MYHTKTSIIQSSESSCFCVTPILSFRVQESLEWSASAQICLVVSLLFLVGCYRAEQQIKTVNVISQEAAAWSQLSTMQSLLHKYSIIQLSRPLWQTEGSNHSNGFGAEAIKIHHLRVLHGGKKENLPGQEINLRMCDDCWRENSHLICAHFKVLDTAWRTE